MKCTTLRYHDRLNGIILFLCCFLSILTQVPSTANQYMDVLMVSVYISDTGFYS